MRTEFAVKTFMTLVVGALVASTNFLTPAARAQNADPVITSFNPVAGTNGASVNIRGNNLLNLTRVTFNGVEATFTEFLSTQFQAVVPTNASTGLITVTTTFGQATSADVFTVINVNAPGITGISPKEGRSGTPVQIDGTNLVTATSVKFHGVEAAFAVNAGILFSTVPANATSGQISVVTPEGTAISADSFTVLKSETAPVITDFKPKTADPGATVQISGSNLGAATAVTFNGVPATFRILFGGVLISATVPVGATTGPIAVVSPTGTDTSADVFTVTSVPPPAITGFNPKNGPPGTSVTIEGNNFVNVIAVRVGGVSAEFNVFGDSVLTTVPPTATTGPITVVATAGSATSADLFTVTEVPKPTITSFEPLSAEPGIQIEIQGSNLSDATSVRFNGVEAVFNVLAASVFATVPTNAVSGSITITTPAGQATSPTSFTILEPSAEPPSIIDFSPTSGAVGETVTIRGTNLTAVAAVKFNGVDAVFTNAFSNLISAIVPTNATTGPITVFTATSTNATPAFFTVTNAEPRSLPIVESFSPTNGVAGTSVEIRGTNFVDVIDVRFNGIEAAFTTTSATSISAKVPADAVTGPITITTAAGTSASSTSFEIDTSSEPPKMLIRAVAVGQVEISWPDSAKDFVLQESQDVGDGNGWKNLTAPPVHSDGTFQVTVAAGPGVRFYRLVHP